MNVETVGQLRELLEGFADDAPLRCIHQSHYPLVGALHGVADDVELQAMDGEGPGMAEDTRNVPYPSMGPAWLVVSDHAPDDVNPYGPSALWEVAAGGDICSR